VTALGIPGTVELVEGDMLKPDTLEEVLDDVERVLLISSPDQHLVETQCTFIDAAKRAGVRHIVKFSGMGCWSDSTFRFARMHAEVERYLEGSGVAWTHLRPSTFMQTHLRDAVPTISHDGTLNLPMGDAQLSPVDRPGHRSGRRRAAARQRSRGQALRNDRSRSANHDRARRTRFISHRPTGSLR
jgi:uncharacterized protein YbjT (DUF2867 family)